MTTVRTLFCEDLYLKGQPISEMIGTSTNNTLNNITNLTNDVINMNAILNGLFGGTATNNINAPQPIIHNREPNKTDDMNDNWDVGSIWVDNMEIAYVCVDNAELNARWRLLSDPIDDINITQDRTFSSYRIIDEFKSNLATIYTKSASDAKLLLKSDLATTYNKTDVNDLLNTKANITTTYNKTDVDAKLLLKSDESTMLNFQTSIEILRDVFLKSLVRFPLKPFSYNWWNPSATSMGQSSFTNDFNTTNISIYVSSVVANYFSPSDSSVSAPFDGIVEGLSSNWLSNSNFYGSDYTQYTDGDTLYIKVGYVFEPHPLYRTIVDGNRVGSQYVGIDCGLAMVFFGFKLFFKEAVAGDNFKEYHICGSNDNINFTSLYYTDNEDYSKGRMIVEPLAYTTPYRYYRIAIINIVNPNGVNHLCNLQEWVFLQSPDKDMVSFAVGLDNLNSSFSAFQADTTNKINQMRSVIDSIGSLSGISGNWQLYP